MLFVAFGKIVLILEQISLSLSLSALRSLLKCSRIFIFITSPYTIEKILTFLL